MTTSTPIQRRRRLALAVGILISLIFLVLAFRGLQPQAFIASLSAVDPRWLLVGAVTYFGAVAIISLRWQFLLNALKRIALPPLMGIVAVGYMGNNVYPLRAGEALRIYLLRRNHDLPVGGSAATVVVERAFDGLVMLTFIFVGLALVDVQSQEVQTVATFALPLFVIGTGLFFLLAAFPALLSRVVQTVAGFLPGALAERVIGLADDVLAGLRGLRSPLQLLGAVVASYLTWAVEAVVYWMVLIAFGLDLGYPVALLVVGTVNLAGLIPASPGQIGVYEFFASSVLIAAGIAQDTALAYAIVVHIVIWLPVTLVGFAVLVRMGLGWQAVTRAQELEASAASSG